MAVVDQSNLGQGLEIAVDRRRGQRRLAIGRECRAQLLRGCVALLFQSCQHALARLSHPQADPAQTLSPVLLDAPPGRAANSHTSTVPAVSGWRRQTTVVDPQTRLEDFAGRLNARELDEVNATLLVTLSLD